MCGIVSDCRLRSRLNVGMTLRWGRALSRKVHIICGKCGSLALNFVINEPCPDDPQNVVSLRCENCGELTGIQEWSEWNNREIHDRRNT